MKENDINRDLYRAGLVPAIVIGVFIGFVGGVIVYAVSLDGLAAVSIFLLGSFFLSIVLWPIFGWLLSVSESSGEQLRPPKQSTKETSPDFSRYYIALAQGDIGPNFEVIKELKQFGQDAVPVFLAGVYSANANVRSESVRALLDIAPDTTISYICEAMRSKPQPYIYETFIYALGKTGSQQAAECISELIINGHILDVDIGLVLLALEDLMSLTKMKEMMIVALEQRTVSSLDIYTFSRYLRPHDLPLERWLGNNDLRDMITVVIVAMREDIMYSLLEAVARLDADAPPWIIDILKDYKMWAEVESLSGKANTHFKRGAEILIALERQQN